MGAVLIDIAEAVKDAINAASLSQSATATRQYSPIRRLDDLGTDLYVTVIPRAIQIEAAARAGGVHRYQVDVGIQKRLTADTNPAPDALVQYVEEIVDLFYQGTVDTASATYRCVDAENDPVFWQRHMMTRSIFTSVVSLTFWAVR